MIWLSRLLRAGVVLTCLVVLSGIVPISLTHFHTGDACPNLGPIPACYVVSVCYTAMAAAALIFWRNLSWLFFVGATPVILLAVAGTTLELIGRPTCPLSETGLPLCYVSLAIGCSLLLGFLLALFFEKRAPHP
ncbi:MAG: hypothetical protein ABJ327_23885 [Litoreibacter sp.]